MDDLEFNVMMLLSMKTVGESVDHRGCALSELNRSNIVLLSVERIDGS